MTKKNDIGSLYVWTGTVPTPGYLRFVLVTGPHESHAICFDGRECFLDYYGSEDSLLDTDITWRGHWRRLSP